MNSYPITPLLQPLAATTPLAALLNRWLVALAPAAALINPRRPSAARECLQDVTTGVHFFHHLVTKTIERLEVGKDLKPLMRYIRHNHYRACLGRPVYNVRPALALAMRSGELQTAQQVYKIAGYTWEHLAKLMALPSPFEQDRATLEALFEGAMQAAWKLEEPGPDIRQATADALTLLHSIIAADIEAIKQ